MQNLQNLILQPPISADAAVDVFRDGNFLLVACSQTPLLAEITSAADGSLTVLPLVEGQSVKIPGGFKYVRLRLNASRASAWASSQIHLVVGADGAEVDSPVGVMRTITRTIPHIARASVGSVHTFTEEPGFSGFYLPSEKIPTLTANATLCIALPNRNAIRRKVSILYGVSASKITANQVSKSQVLRSVFPFDTHDLCAVFVSNSPFISNAKDATRSYLLRSITGRLFAFDNLGVSEEIYSAAGGAYKRGDAVVIEGGGPLFMTIDPDYTADAALYVKVEETFRVREPDLSNNAFLVDSDASKFARGEPNSWTTTI